MSAYWKRGLIPFSMEGKNAVCCFDRIKYVRVCLIHMDFPVINVWLGPPPILRPGVLNPSLAAAFYGSGDVSADGLSLRGSMVRRCH